MISLIPKLIDDIKNNKKDYEDLFIKKYIEKNKHGYTEEYTIGFLSYEDPLWSPFGFICKRFSGYIKWVLNHKNFKYYYLFTKNIHNTYMLQELCHRWKIKDMTKYVYPKMFFYNRLFESNQYGRSIFSQLCEIYPRTIDWIIKDKRFDSKNLFVQTVCKYSPFIHFCDNRPDLAERIIRNKDFDFNNLYIQTTGDHSEGSPIYIFASKKYKFFPWIVKHKKFNMKQLFVRQHFSTPFNRINDYNNYPELLAHIIMRKDFDMSNLYIASHLCKQSVLTNMIKQNSEVLLMINKKIDTTKITNRISLFYYLILHNIDLDYAEINVKILKRLLK